MEYPKELTPISFNKSSLPQQARFRFNLDKDTICASTPPRHSDTCTPPQHSTLLPFSQSA